MAIITIPAAEPAPPPPRKARWVEQALEIRVGDLLRLLKRPGQALASRKFEHDGVVISATLDLRSWKEPHLLVEIHLIEANQTHMQKLLLNVRPGGFGGWTGQFLCPALSPIGEPCERRVLSLYLPPAPSVARFACRHCHSLIHRSKEHWLRGAGKRLKAARAASAGLDPEGQGQTYQSRRGALVPPELVIEQWVDSLPETAAGRNRRLLEQTWLALRSVKLNPGELGKIQRELESPSR